jgi:hypothetical protein
MHPLLVNGILAVDIAVLIVGPWLAWPNRPGPCDVLEHRGRSSPTVS